MITKNDLWYNYTNMRFDEPQTYYQVLGVMPDASTEEIRKAYYRLARLYHPDYTQNQEDRHMIELNRIWEVLSHPDQRQEYDTRLGLIPKNDYTRNEKKTSPQDITDIRDNKPEKREKRQYLKILERVLIVFMLVLIAYIAFYLVVNILDLYVELPAWILKLIPRY